MHCGLFYVNIKLCSSALHGRGEHTGAQLFIKLKQTFC